MSLEEPRDGGLCTQTLVSGAPSPPNNWQRSGLSSRAWRACSLVSE